MPPKRVHYNPYHRGNKRRYYATKIQKMARGWLRRRRRYARRGTSIRTGFLDVQQKQLRTDFVIPAGNYPTGEIKKWNFKGADLTQWATFSSLFDQYRISGIKMTFLPVTNTADTSNQGGTFAYSVDLDGDGLVQTMPQLLECSNSHTRPWSSAGGLRPFQTVSFAPRVHDAVITSIGVDGQPTSFSSGLANRKQWLDISDRGTTIHYGLITGWYFGNDQLNNDMHFNIVITYYMQFRKVR